MAPRALDGVVMSARTPINEASVVIDGAMRVTLRVEIPVRRPAITDDCSPGSCMYNGHKSFSGSVRSGNEKRFTRLELNTAKNSLNLNSVAPMIYAPTDFDSLVRTADPIRAALQVHQYGLSAELAPVSHGNRPSAIGVMCRVASLSQ